jgi:hypothetical protein
MLHETCETAVCSHTKSDRSRVKKPSTYREAALTARPGKPPVKIQRPFDPNQASKLKVRIDIIGFSRWRNLFDDYLHSTSRK